MLKLSCGLLCVLLLAMIVYPLEHIQAEGTHPGNQPFVFQGGPLLLSGAHVVTAPEQPSVLADVLVSQGRIVAVGTGLTFPEGTRRVDLTGHVIYAGFIDAACTRIQDTPIPVQTGVGASLPLMETALASTPLDQHDGVTPDHDDSRLISPATGRLNELREAGFTSVQVCPQGRVISGQAVHLLLGTATRQGSILRANAHQMIRLKGLDGNQYPSTEMGAVAQVRQKLLDAQWLGSFSSVENVSPQYRGVINDPVLVALRPLLAGTQQAVFDVQTVDEFTRALTVIDEFGLRPAFVGGRELSATHPTLMARQYPWILDVDFGGKPEATAATADVTDQTLAATSAEPAPLLADRIERRLKRIRLLTQLHARPEPVAITLRKLSGPGELKEVLKWFREAEVSPKIVLAALTTGPAKLLGLSEQVGTIEAGKLANLTVLTGPLEHAEAKVRHVFVAGEQFEFHRDAKPVSPGTQPQGTALASLAGKWTAKIEAGATGDLQPQFEFQTVGAALQGQFRSEQGDGQVIEAKRNGSEFQVEVRIGAGAKAVQLKWQGQLSQPTGDVASQQWIGTVSTAFGAPASFTAKRVIAVDPTAAGTVSSATVSTPPVSIPPVSSPPVQITGLDETASPAVSALPPLSPGEPVDALQPLNRGGAPSQSIPSGTVQAAVSVNREGVPVELWSDRFPRSTPTGGNLLVRGATVHDGAGHILPATDVSIVHGLIVAIGPNLVAEPGQQVREVPGWHVIPGMVDTHSHMMLGDGLNGVNEATRSIVCEVRTQDVVSTHDVNEFRALSGGLTTARLLHGSANTIGGQHVVVQLRLGEPTANHVFPAPAGVKFALGENVKRPTDRFPQTRLGVEAVLQRAFVEAVEYRTAWQKYERQRSAPHAAVSSLIPPRRDLRLEALVEIIEQQRWIHCHSYRADEILMLLRLADTHNLKIRSLQHVLEGYKVAPEIAAHGASCSTFSDWWAYKVEAYDAIPYNAAFLHDAGVNSVLKSDDFELMRHMNVEAAKTLRYGNLPPEVALQLVTRNPARELGIEDRLGTLEVGHQGDLAVFNGDPLSTLSRCELTIIAGNIYFERALQPTAVSAIGQGKTRLAPQLPRVAAAQRAQPVAWPAAMPARWAISDATVHTISGEVIENGLVIIDQKQLAYVGTRSDFPATQSVPETVVPVAGRHLFPGLIDAGATVGLVEIGAIMATIDTTEVGSYQPDLRTGIAVNPDSEMIPVARAGGITLACLLPLGGTIGGQASVIQLAGWTAPDHIVQMDGALRVKWPEGNVEERTKEIRALESFLELGKNYALLRALPETSEHRPPLDPRYEALMPYLNGTRPVFIEAETQDQILDVVRFAARSKLRVVLTGAADGWKVANQLAAAKISVIVGPVMRQPVESHDPYDATYANAGRLAEAGVRVGFRSLSSANSRNLPFEAGVAVAFGMDRETAERGVTLTNAEILGLEDRLGSISIGKQATLIVTDGTPLEPSTQIHGVVIAGQPQPLENKQSRLHDRYRQRLTTLQP